MLGIFVASDAILITMVRAADQWSDFTEINFIFCFSPQAIPPIIGGTGRIAPYVSVHKHTSIGRWEVPGPPLCERGYAASNKNDQRNNETIAAWRL